MFAVEFRAEVKNGMIEIPAEYRDMVKGAVRVIVVAEPEERADNLIDRLLDKPLRVSGFEPLSRDDIYGHS